MDKQVVSFKDLGIINYKAAWDYQESLLQQNVQVKSALAKIKLQTADIVGGQQASALASFSEENEIPDTTNYLLFCEHLPVYTLGKSGHQENILISDDEMREQNIEFFKTNRGGDITFHGPQQIVGYPILDLEKFYTDIGKYLRALEEIIILTLAEYGIKGERSEGETGVWIEPGVPGKERKICAMGVRCSRWITMHGFAFNINTDLGYFDNIIPCGIENKKVTSLHKELNQAISMGEVKKKLKHNFEKVFNVLLVPES